MSSSLSGRIALGTATFAIEAAERDRGADIAAIRAGLDAGIGVIDTARAYSRADDPFSGELLVAEAVGNREDVLVMTKGGHWREDAASWRVDNRAERIRRDAEDSLRSLHRDRLDVYLLHRADDREVDLDVSLDALLAVRDDGLAERIGLSNVTAEQLEHAVQRGAVDVVQNAHGIAHRDDAALAVATVHGIPYFGYSPLRTGGASLDSLLPRLGAVAAARGVPLARLALRDLLADSPDMSLVSGAARIESIRDSAAAEREPWDAEAAEAYRHDLLMRTRTGKDD